MLSKDIRFGYTLQRPMNDFASLSCGFTFFSPPFVLKKVQARTIVSLSLKIHGTEHSRVLVYRNSLGVSGRPTPGAGVDRVCRNMKFGLLCRLVFS